MGVVNKRVLKFSHAMRTIFIMHTYSGNFAGALDFHALSSLHLVKVGEGSG